VCTASCLAPLYHTQALKKSINGIINKVNAANIKLILAEVFREVRDGAR
jgi:hypothetical protein